MGIASFSRAKLKLALIAVGFALAGLSLGGGSSTPAAAGSCDGEALQPAGSATLSACGSAGLSSVGSGSSEISYSGESNRSAQAAGGEPRANAHLGRASSAASPAANQTGNLPPRKTIDLSKLPPELVSPDR